MSQSWNLSRSRSTEQIARIWTSQIFQPAACVCVCMCVFTDTWAGGCAHVCVYAHAGWLLSPPLQVLVGTQLGCSSKSDSLGHSGMRPHLTLTQQLATQHPALGGGLGHSDSSTAASQGHRKPSGEVLGWGFWGGGGVTCLS